MERITDVKKLRTAVTDVIQGAQRLQDKIHLVAVSTLAHAETHGDFTLFARLVYGLPTGQRVQTIKKWAAMFAPVKFADKEKTCRLDKGEKAVEWDLDGAEANPYYQIKEVTKTKPLTLQEVCEYLLKKSKVKDEDTDEIMETRKVIGQIAGFALQLKNTKEPTMADAYAADFNGTPAEQFGDKPRLAA